MLQLILLPLLRWRTRKKQFDNIDPKQIDALVRLQIFDVLGILKSKLTTFCDKYVVDGKLVGINEVSGKLECFGPEGT
jgi:hypothetical protein